MTYLGHCSTLFQIFGQQYFSVRTLKKENQKNFPSIGYTIYFVVAFVVVMGEIVIFSTIALSDGVQQTLSQKTVLNVVVQNSMYVGLVVIIFVSLIQSFVSTPSTKKFFLNCVKIARISHYDFGHPIDHRRIRQKVFRHFLLVLLLYFASENFLYFYEKFFNQFESFLKTATSFLPLMFLTTTCFKFLFYVKLVNDHLENINTLIKGMFESQSTAPLKIKFVQPIKSQPVDLSIKILNLRRSYNIIIENCEIINRTLGKTVFTILVAMVIANIASGYRLLLVMIGKFPVEKIGGKPLKFSIEFNSFPFVQV